MTAAGTSNIKKPWYKKKLFWIFGIFFTSILIIAAFVYYNFNNLLTVALHKSFESTVISDVYELQFEKLRVNFIEGDIRVINVVLQPRKKPLQNYPYINSSFKLTTNKLLLKNVKIKELLRNNVLELDHIEIQKPEVLLNLAGATHILFPFKDSTSVSRSTQGNKKKTIDSFYLKKFELLEAEIKIRNTFDQRNFNISNLNFSFNELHLSQHVGLDSLDCESLSFSIGSMNGTLLQSSVREVSFKTFNFEIDELSLQKSLDTLIFHFDDFRTAINDLNIQTADSVYQITMKAFGLSYKDSTVNITDAEFIPNDSEAEIQKKFPYQKVQVAGRVGTINFKNVNFDTLVYRGKLFVDELVLDSVTASFYKDKTKPIDLNRFPEYPAQQVAAIPFPLYIMKVTAKNSSIINREKRPGEKIATVHVNRINATVKNLTNQRQDENLILEGEAYLENTVHFKIKLDFDYNKPRFAIEAIIRKFNLSSLNKVLKAYTPATINSGVADEISFTGMVYHKNARGELKFLYHDLNIDLQLHEQAQWKSTLGAFAANTYIHAANPIAGDQPQRIVKYNVDRDMNKGFINIVLKSLLGGLKETMIPSKENRKAFQQIKRNWKHKQKDNK